MLLLKRLHFAEDWLFCLGSRPLDKQRGLDARPPGFMLARYGHIEMFSKMPKWLYRLFDVSVGLDPSHQDAITWPFPLGIPGPRQCAKAQGVWVTKVASAWSVSGVLYDRRSRSRVVAPVEGAPWRIGALEAECVLPWGLSLHVVGDGSL
ncbi:hypothetical protein CRG98_000660 [Punica granatum]|uniref:Uncharacterized protein n=1 Tax=Punica granatum TaxID=22663 RepID=A0A2I0LE50_PUNGR|nr:hypothetical protein CRG98_000660 [Punica granatum]